MKRFLIAIYLFGSTAVFAQDQRKDSLPEGNVMPNVLPRMSQLQKKLYESNGRIIFELPGRMGCVVPDSSFRSNMPIKKSKPIFQFKR